MPKKLQHGEPTVKIEVKMGESLKRLVQEAARIYGDGDVANWVRALVRAELKRLRIEPVIDGGKMVGWSASTPRPPRAPRSKTKRKTNS